MRVISSSDLQDLHDKYARMLTLRELHERAKQDPTFIEPPPHAEMKKLATRYPGALRELDSLPLASLRTRLTEIARAQQDVSCIQFWMKVQCVFHEHARSAFFVKRWLAGRKEITPVMREALATLPEATPYVAHVDELAMPTGGRVLPIVYRHVAAELALSVEEVRAAIWGG